MNREACRQKVRKQLTTLVAPHIRRLPITDETEIYYDLRIFGHDLYDFVVWAGAEFGIDGPINLDEYGPREGISPLLFRDWRVCRERQQGRYKSLKIRDVLIAIETGQWPATSNRPLGLLPPLEQG